MGTTICSTGSSTSLSWLDRVLSKRYEIKTQRVGIGKGCTREGQILNRVVRVANEGFEMEADQRHAGRIIEQLQLKAGKGVSSPGIYGQDDREGDALEALGPWRPPRSEGWRPVSTILARTAPTSCFQPKRCVGRSHGEVYNEAQEDWALS